MSPKNETIVSRSAVTTKGAHYAVIYKWPDGREEIRYTRPISDASMAWEVKRYRSFWRNRNKAEHEAYSVRRLA
jgi:hypothetical protein